MWFKIDYDRLIVMLLPTFLRRERMTAWLRSLLTPVSSLYNNWFGFRSRNIYQLAHNGQVVYLRAALNDSFDPVERRIQIIDGNRFKRKFIYTNPEQKPRFLGTMYLNRSLDFADTGVDFIVAVPAGLVFNPIDMTALVNFYKIASKRYKIDTL